MNPVDTHSRIMLEQHQDRLVAAQRARLLGIACPRHLPLLRRLASPAGRTLLRLGGWLVRYSRAELREQLVQYHASRSSLRMN